MQTEPNFFDLIGETGRRVLEEAARPLHLAAGRTLFSEGDEARSLFFVRTGSLGVYVDDLPGPTVLRGGISSGAALGKRSNGAEDSRLVYVVGAGETVGEMAVISGEPRSATVIAIRDTDLLVLSRQRFSALLKTHPVLMSSVMRLLSHRLRQLTRGEPATIEPTSIALIPASPQVDVSAIARRLKAGMARLGARAHVLGDQARNYSPAWFAERERRHDFLLLASDPADPAWQSVCARQADRLVVVADASKRERLSLPQSLLAERQRHQLLDLVLLHPNAGIASNNVAYWRERVPVNRHFHLRNRSEADWSRVARILCGRANGLVLSGGAARGLAHIGVLRALEEAAIPLDFIGGTSMGAIVAACAALEMSAAEIEEQLRKNFLHRNPMSDFTIPFVSLVSGRRAERMLEENFSDRRIEELPRTFYAVSSNLTTGGPFIHRSGLLRHALRASSALPGIFPPWPAEGGLLVDGAATNNLPVATMRALHRGPVIAVDVARDLAITPQALAAETHGPWYARLLRPPILSILIRSATISSEETDRREAAMADLLLSPPLGEIEVRDWKAFDRAVEIGYTHAQEVLAGEPRRFRPTGSTTDAEKPAAPVRVS
ncbi:MAG: patatin-like phospholipase family protein [Pseudomonadota bacterium]